nr:DNA helicase [Tanacetum cinerariifolium]
MALANANTYGNRNKLFAAEAYKNDNQLHRKQPTDEAIRSTTGLPLGNNTGHFPIDYDARNMPKKVKKISSYTFSNIGRTTTNNNPLGNVNDYGNSINSLSRGTYTNKGQSHKHKSVNEPIRTNSYLPTRNNKPEVALSTDMYIIDLYNLQTCDILGAIVFADSFAAENEFDLIIEEHSRFPRQDMAPMNDRRCFEALDRSLKDICNRPDTSFRGDPDETDNENTFDVQMPNKLCILDSDTTLATLISFIYDQKTLQTPTTRDLQKRAIVCQKNKNADMINAHVLNLVNRQQHVYLSLDEAMPHGNDGGKTELLYPPGYLNSLNFANFPPHMLELMVGAPIILLRNFNILGGLCNRTRLIVTQLLNKVIEARIITGTRISKKVFLPRIPLINRDLQLPFIFKRKQFPIKLCYAITINKVKANP